MPRFFLNLPELWGLQNHSNGRIEDCFHILKRAKALLVKLSLLTKKQNKKIIWCLIPLVFSNYTPHMRMPQFGDIILDPMHKNIISWNKTYNKVETWLHTCKRHPRVLTLKKNIEQNETWF